MELNGHFITRLFLLSLVVPFISGLACSYVFPEYQNPQTCLEYDLTYLSHFGPYNITPPGLYRYYVKVIEECTIISSFHPPIHICLSIYPSMYLTICPSIHLYLSIHPSIHLSICLLMGPFVDPSIHFKISIHYILYILYRFVILLLLICLMCVSASHLHLVTSIVQKLVNALC